MINKAKNAVPSGSYTPLVRPAIYNINSINTSSEKSTIHNVPILFHGVNKSGSLAFAKALHMAYKESGNIKRFMCRYMQMPAGREEALAQFSQKLEINPILIDHGLFGYEKNYPGAKCVTMLRDPMKRVFSIYYWLLSHHPEKIMGRDIISWVRQDWRTYAQVRQFAFDNRATKTAHIIDQKPIGEMISVAEANFSNNISWFGICELFEASVISFLSQIGINQAPVWELDKRNTAKPKPVAIPRGLEREISELIGFDIAFYEIKKQKFLRSLQGAPYLEDIEKYREKCEQNGNYIK